MSVEDRLARLERENCRLKLGGLLVLVLMGSVFLMGQTRPPQVVEAAAFVLRDTEGRALASLAVDEDGFPRFRLIDKTGMTRTDFHVTDDALFVFLRESTGQPTLEFAVRDGATGPSIALYPSASKHTGIILQAPTGIEPFINVRSHSGPIIWSAP